jgi:hypothetical protein
VRGSEGANRLCSKCRMPDDVVLFSSLSVVCGICELIGECVSLGCVVGFLKGRNSATWVLTVLVGPCLGEALLVVG